jgi:hypothetical protein
LAGSRGARCSGGRLTAAPVELEPLERLLRLDPQPSCRGLLGVPLPFEAELVQGGLLLELGDLAGARPLPAA